MDTLPIEVKMQILLNLPVEQVSFITDTYFWILYDKKHEHSKKFKKFSCLANYTINRTLGECDYVTSLYGTALYLGHIDETFQTVHFKAESDEPCWFHIFFKKEGKHSYCLKFYHIFQSYSEYDIGQKVDLQLAISKTNTKVGIYSRLKSQVSILKETELQAVLALDPFWPVTDEYIQNYTQIYAFICLNPEIVESNHISSFIKQNERTIGIIVPQTSCMCDWWFDKYFDECHYREMYLNGRNKYRDVLHLWDAYGRDYIFPINLDLCLRKYFSYCR